MSDFPQFDCEYRKEIMCPFCGHKHSDSWELAPSEECGEVICNSCGKDFTVTVSTSVFYTSVCNTELKEQCDFVDPKSQVFPEMRLCSRCGNTKFLRK